MNTCSMAGVSLLPFAMNTFFCFLWSNADDRLSWIASLMSIVDTDGMARRIKDPVSAMRSRKLLGVFPEAGCSRIAVAK